MEKISNKLFNIAFISIFFMYFKIIPIPIETQPIIIIICIVISIILSFTTNNFTINRNDKLLLVHIFLLTLFFCISLFQNENIYDCFIMLMKLVMGPLAYLMVLKNVKYLKEKNVKIVIKIIAILAIIQLTRFPVLYNATNTLYSLFFNRYTIYLVGSNSVRGLSVLVTEPSYFVYFEILLFYSIDFLKYKNKQFENEYIYKLIVFIIAILTKSAIVYLFTLVYILQNISIKKLLSRIKYYFQDNIGILISIIVSFIIFIILFDVVNIESIKNTRFYQVVNSLINTDIKNIGELLFYSDDSSGFRFLTNTVGYLSVLLYPLGGGMLTVRKDFLKIADIFGIEAYRNEIIRYSKSTVIEIAAYIPTIVSVLGCFSIVFLTYIYSLRIRTKNKLSKQMFFTLFLFLFLIQSNLFNPVFWIIIGFISYINKEGNQKNEQENMYNYYKLQ